MSCGELFVNLGGGGSTPPDGMLQTAVAINGSLQVVKDNLGNSSTLNISTTLSQFISNGSNDILKLTDSSGIIGIRNYITSGSVTTIKLGRLTDTTIAAYLSHNNGNGDFTITQGYNGANIKLIVDTNSLSVSNTGVNIGSGTITNNGLLTIKGSGSNILSFRDSSNVEKASVSNTGAINSTSIDTTTQGTFQNRQIGLGYGYNSSLNLSSEGIINWATTSGDINGKTFDVALIRSTTNTLRISNNSTGYGGFETGIASALAFQVARVSSTAAIGFFAVSPVNQITTAVAGAAYADGGGVSFIKTTDTIGGYTMQQIVQALLNYGLLRP